MAKTNNFKKEYVTGRKDQQDIDKALFKKCVDETETREELIQLYEDKMSFVNSKITYDRGSELTEEMGLA